MITEEVFQDFVKGDRKAFDKIYSAYSAAIYGVCLRYTRCPDDAQDVLQETFIKVYRNCGSYSPASPFPAWIKTIAINSALNYIKQNYRFELHEDDQVFDRLQETELPNEDREELKKHLLKILNQLPDGYRTIFNLFVIDNLTHKEIAEYLSISENTSKSQYFKAKKMIHSLLEVQTTEYE